VEVQVPRFAFKSRYLVNDTLAALGVKTLFDDDRADLSGISTEKPFYVDSIVHEALVEVDEEGTTAAAVTGGAFGAGSSSTPRPILFRADRPFLFLIRDERTGIILFLGRMARPTEANDAAKK
jgi:serpin B